MPFESAFPFFNPGGGEDSDAQYGFSKREHIAIMAMHAMLANGHYGGESQTIFDHARVISMKAGIYADEMMQLFNNQ